MSKFGGVKVTESQFGGTPVEKEFIDPANASEAFNINPLDVYEDEFNSEQWELDQATLYYLRKKWFCTHTRKHFS